MVAPSAPHATLLIPIIIITTTITNEPVFYWRMDGLLLDNQSVLVVVLCSGRLVPPPLWSINKPLNCSRRRPSVRRTGIKYTPSQRQLSSVSLAAAAGRSWGHIANILLRRSNSLQLCNLQWCSVVPASKILSNNKLNRIIFANTPQLAKTSGQWQVGNLTLDIKYR